MEVTHTIQDWFTLLQFFKRYGILVNDKTIKLFTDELEDIPVNENNIFQAHQRIQYKKQQKKDQEYFIAMAGCW